MLDRKGDDEYADYLTKLEKLEKESEDAPLAFQVPPEDLLVEWTMNLRKDKKTPYLPDAAVDHSAGTIKTYLSRVAGTVKEYAGSDVASPSSCAILRTKLAEWKKVDGEEQSATFDNLPEDLEKLYDANFEGKQRWNALQRIPVWSM